MPWSHFPFYGQEEATFETPDISGLCYRTLEITANLFQQNVGSRTTYTVSFSR